MSEATRRRLSESSRAYMNRPEVIERYREVRSRPKSEETRRKMAERATGRTLSDDVKSRISAANRGRKQVVEPDRGEKISAAKKGMVMTEAHRRALSAAKRGRKRGPLCAETRAKIAAGRRAYFAARAAE